MANLVIMPRLSLNEDTSLLAEWYVSEGDHVSVGDKLFSIETDKSSMDVDSEFEGVILKRYWGEYEVVPVLTAVCAVGEEGEQVPPAPEAESAVARGQAEEGAEANAGAGAGTDAGAAAAAGTLPAQGTTAGGAGMNAALSSADAKKGVSPRARKLAEKNGITQIEVIRASGAENRILEEDIIRFMSNGREPEVAAAVSREGKPVRLPRIRQVIARNMMTSLQTTAQFTMTSLFNASAVQALRAQFKAEQGEMKGVTIGDLVLFAVSRTLPEFLTLNSWMKDEQQALEFDHVQLGCAVDTERGLMVPTIVDADLKSLKEISDNLKELAGACRTGNIVPEKMQGATFTVSNLGAFGIRSFTPVLNPPQVGILGVGAIDYMVKQTKEGLLYYPACTLSLTVDHRLVDGGYGARFLRKRCENLEQIEALF